MAGIGPPLAASVLGLELIAMSYLTVLVVVPRFMGGLTVPSQVQGSGRCLDELRSSSTSKRESNVSTQPVTKAPQGCISRTVKRRVDNPKLVTGTVSHMCIVLGDATNNDRLTIRDETWVTALVRKPKILSMLH